MKKIKKKRKLRRLKKALLITTGVTVGLVATLVIYNQIKSCNINNADPIIDPFSPNNMFDDDDLEFDDNGEIVFDTMTDSEKNILSDQFKKFILQDANSRASETIADVEKILSINLFPSNLYSENDSNIYDKYYLSILFTDGNKNYTLNYYTGKTFESKEELSKNIFTDYINYLSYDCALDNCENISEIGQEIQTMLGDNVCYVGNAYEGHKESGEGIYCVPIYYSDGNYSIYYATKTLIDMDNLNPMQELCEELAQEDKQKLFTISYCTKDVNLAKFMELYQSMIISSESEEVKQN